MTGDDGSGADATGTVGSAMALGDGSGVVSVDSSVCSGATASSLMAESSFADSAAWLR